MEGRKEEERKRKGRERRGKGERSETGSLTFKPHAYVMTEL